MNPAERHQEALQILRWYVGDDTTRPVHIEWSMDKKPQEIDGDSSLQAKFDSFSPMLLDELVKFELIHCEHEAATGLGSSLRGYNSSTVRLLPAALSLSRGEPYSQEDARYASITLDTYEFAKMLEGCFSNSEQMNLCMELGLDYESVVPSGATKQLSAQAIVEHMRRQNRLTDLWRASVGQRPNSDWARLLRG